MKAFPFTHGDLHLSREDTALMCCAVLMLGLFMFMPEPAEPRLPELASLEPDAKKARFFSFLRPVVADANDRVRRDKARLVAIKRKLAASGRPLSWFDYRRLDALAEAYDVDLDDASPTDEAVLSALEQRIDTVPASLALAQAAKESGWGTSRFAIEGNNLYGQRCYRAGCGIAPQGRPDADFGVARFDSIAESVRSYMRNLNTHERYEAFRQQRRELREAGEPLTGLRLADALVDYSERGAAYTAEIKSLIRNNELEAAR